MFTSPIREAVLTLVMIKLAILAAVFDFEWPIFQLSILALIGGAAFVFSAYKSPTRNLSTLYLCGINVALSGLLIIRMVAQMLSG